MDEQILVTTISELKSDVRRLDDKCEHIREEVMRKTDGIYEEYLKNSKNQGYEIREYIINMERKNEQIQEQSIKNNKANRNIKLTVIFSIIALLVSFFFSYINDSKVAAYKNEIEKLKTENIVLRANIDNLEKSYNSIALNAKEMNNVIQNIADSLKGKK